MVPTPLRPRQNALVILALFLVAGALFPWSPPFRLACAACAIGIVLMLLLARLRAHVAAPPDKSGGAVHDRIDRIRAARDARMGPRR